MLRHRFVILAVLLLLSLSPIPAFAQAPAVQAEDCENCIDDDGDGAVDRADSDCAPPSDGANGGLGDAGAAGSVENCSEVLQRAGAKLARARLTPSRAVSAAATCVQKRSGDASCRTLATAACARNPRSSGP